MFKNRCVVNIFLSQNVRGLRGAYVTGQLGGGGGYFWEFLVAGLCRPVLQILTLFQTRKCHFPHPLSDQTNKIHTRFQTWPFGRNYVIIT